MVSVIEIVIDLGNPVVAVSGGGNRAEEVAIDCRKVVDKRWPQDGRGIGCWIAYQVLGTRTGCNSVGGQQSQSLGLPGKGRFGGQSGQADDVILLLEGSEKECSVLENRTPDTEPVVLISYCGRSGIDGARLEEG